MLRYWVAVRSWSWLCLLSCAACGHDGIDTRYWIVHGLDAYETTPDAYALDAALELVVRETGALRGLARADKEHADLHLERSPFESSWGTVVGLYSPPRTIRAVWYDGDCLASGGVMHEMIHYLLDLERRDIDRAHAGPEWQLDGALDRATDLAFAERLGCPP